MLRIGLLGYGKMGRAIEQIILQQDMQVAWRIGQSNRQELTQELLKSADVVIEFSRPEAAFDNVMLCLQAGVPVVSGTTGWAQELLKAETFCHENGGAMLWASNFSIGVNLFFAINEYAATLMQRAPEYQASLTEIHHIHKLDAPSGTAISLAKQIIAHHKQYTDWNLSTDASGDFSLPIEAIREGEVPGTHVIQWQGPDDEITLEHKAHSRRGFAAGAVLAARWLAGRKGVFQMRDVLFS